MWWKFVMTPWSGHEAFPRSAWDQRKKIIEFHPHWCFVFLFSRSKLLDKLYPSQEVYDPLIENCTVPIQKDTVYDTEMFVHYFVKCNLPFCFQLQYLWCISVFVMMYGLLHGFSCNFCWACTEFIQILFSDCLFILFI